MVAIVSSKGFRWSSSQAAGYISASRSTVHPARSRAPRGARGNDGRRARFAPAGGRAERTAPAPAPAPTGSPATSFRRELVKQPPRQGGDPCALGPAGEPGAGGLHHGAEVARAPRPDLVDHRPELALELFVA